MVLAATVDPSTDCKTIPVHASVEDIVLIRTRQAAIVRASGVLDGILLQDKRMFVSIVDLREVQIKWIDDLCFRFTHGSLSTRC